MDGFREAAGDPELSPLPTRTFVFDLAVHTASRLVGNAVFAAVLFVFPLHYLPVYIVWISVEAVGIIGSYLNPMDPHPTERFRGRVTVACLLALHLSCVVSTYLLRERIPSFVETLP